MNLLFAGFEAKQQRKGPYIDDAVRAGSEFSAYLEGKGSLPEGARFPIVAGKPVLLLLVLPSTFPSKCHYLTLFREIMAS